MTCTGYADLGDIPEDERIRQIVQWCRAHPGQIVLVATDRKPKSKVQRYKRKLERAGVHVLGIGDGPVDGAVSLRVTDRKPS